MKSLLEQITKKKQKLDSLKPLPPELEKNLYEWNRIALTYSSNAIEGNTLSHQDTAMVVEKGITVGGKTMREHLEAINHADAVDFIKKISTEKSLTKDLTTADILDIHRIVLQRIDNNNAGSFRSVAVRIMGSSVIFPNHMKVPVLMDEFTQWLQKSTHHPATIAADAHFKLVSIHPFVDGNGRTARLLMNLILLQAGYPLTIIEKEDRSEYITSIEQARRDNDMESFHTFIYKAIDAGLDRYLEMIEE